MICMGATSPALRGCHLCQHSPSHLKGYSSPASRPRDLPGDFLDLGCPSWAPQQPWLILATRTVLIVTPSHTSTLHGHILSQVTRRPVSLSGSVTPAYSLWLGLSTWGPQAFRGVSSGL